MWRRVFLGLVFLLSALLVLEIWLYRQVRARARHDEAREVDVIVILGAAEYNGVPSPVFKARLDHALSLYERGLAGYFITTGGRGGDPRFTEAGVGRDYLIQAGVPAEAILADEQSNTTFQNVQGAARLMHQRGYRICLAVSDGFHLYRVKQMFADMGVTAYTSPAPQSPIEADGRLRFLHSLREAATSTLWFFGVRG